MDLVEDLADPIVPIATACQALGVSRASLYRCTRPAPPRSLLTQRARSPRRVSDAERATILDTFHSAEFGDQSVVEVYATLLSRGVYLASIRTMYRVLAAHGETKERRNQRRPHVYEKPSLTATASNQVWTWDISAPG
jgi:putative transposase